MSHWAEQAVFYHVYPLGLCGAPRLNDYPSGPVPRVEKLVPWLDHARDLGATALLLGPVMESETHGYDLVDYFKVDRRLGEPSTLAQLADAVHARGLKLVMDAVFNHVGRNFWAFRDVREKGRDSRFIDWFHLDFNERSPVHDPFSYQTWNGCHELVKLNLNHPQTKSHLFDAAAAWVRDYRIDGFRLDAAAHLDLGFIRELGACCRGLKPDFWLMGEVVKGPYTPWLDHGGLDAVTNYEGYEGLYSSHNDQNYFELAYTLKRHFGPDGLYQPINLYNFADNHDVDRVASRLHDHKHLYPLHCLLFTMPGIPSIYYGSEFGLEGRKPPDQDWPLRPALDLKLLRTKNHHPDLARTISRLADLRAKLPALRQGDYQELFLSPRRLGFSRRTPQQWLVVAVSAEVKPVVQEVVLPEPINGRLVDHLNPGQSFRVRNGRAKLAPLWPCWARILEVRRD